MINNTAIYGALLMNNHRIHNDYSKEFLIKSCSESYNEVACDDVCIRDVFIESQKNSIWDEEVLYQTQNICTHVGLSDPFYAHEMPDATEVVLGALTAFVIALMVYLLVEKEII